MELDKTGCYKRGMLSAIPYKHYNISTLWHVEVLQNIGEDDYTRKGMRVIADNHLQACTFAMDQYERLRKSEMDYRKDKENLIKEKRKIAREKYIKELND